LCKKIEKTMKDKIQRTHWLRQKAFDLGFSFVGIAQAEELTAEARLLEQWLNKGYQGKMAYLENHFDKRIDPRKLVEGTRSVVTLLYNYYNPAKQQDPTAPKIAMYAYGKDYHDIIRAKLNALLADIGTTWGADCTGRGFVDSAPILERDWARRAGLGWQGKHTLLINKGHGSYFFIAELLINQELIYDNPIKDFCGTCTRCIDACPTKAISPAGYLLDSSRCISYLTIELKEAIPEDFRAQMSGWAFGCDICQQVCPWNRFSQAHHDAQLMPPAQLLSMSRSDWQALNETTFQQLFKGSAVKRTKYVGLRRNIDFLTEP
jgi:epoxyqueuosine reductase